MSNIISVCAGCGAKNRIPPGKEYASGKCGKCGKSLADSFLTGQVVEVYDSNFSDIVEITSMPVLVDFFSPTCGPCQILAPVLENVANNFSGKAVVSKINTATNLIQAAKFQIKGVPTLLFFKNRELAEQVVGVVSQVEIENKLKNLL